MNSITKMAIYEAQFKEITNLVERASEGSILSHEQEYLIESFNGFVKVNKDMMKDLHNEHMETIKRSMRIMKRSRIV